MGAVTSTALDLLTGALRKINVLAAGEPLDATDAADGLQVLNDLLESLSTDRLYVYSSNYSKLAWNPGQYDYTIGNPTQGSFVGACTVGTPYLTGVVSTLTLTYGLNAAGVRVGGTITDTLGLLPSGTTISTISANTGVITLSQNATGTSLSNLFTYTAPGDFAISRPLRLRPGYTRITASGNTGLDYWYDVVNFDDYNQIGYKGVPGPWPYVVSYKPDFPYAHLFVYPAPQQAGEVHFFSDVILSDLTSTTATFSLPQGYSRSIKTLLALEFCPEYGKTPSPELLRQAWEARTFIKSLNEMPVKKMNYDSALMAGNGKDASFIMHGGFGSNL
jgi:hypothetical protein